MASPARPGREREALSAVAFRQLCATVRSTATPGSVLTIVWRAAPSDAWVTWTADVHGVENAVLHVTWREQPDEGIVEFPNPECVFEVLSLALEPPRATPGGKKRARAAANTPDVSVAVALFKAMREADDSKDIILESLTGAKKLSKQLVPGLRIPDHISADEKFLFPHLYTSGSSWLTDFNLSHRFGFTPTEFEAYDELGMWTTTFCRLLDQQEQYNTNKVDLKPIYWLLIKVICFCLSHSKLFPSNSPTALWSAFAKGWEEGRLDIPLWITTVRKQPHATVVPSTQPVTVPAMSVQKETPNVQRMVEDALRDFRRHEPRSQPAAPAAPTVVFAPSPQPVIRSGGFRSDPQRRKRGTAKNRRGRAQQ